MTQYSTMLCRSLEYCTHKNGQFDRLFKLEYARFYVLSMKILNDNMIERERKNREENGRVNIYFKDYYEKLADELHNDLTLTQPMIPEVSCQKPKFGLNEELFNLEEMDFPEEILEVPAKEFCQLHI